MRIICCSDDAVLLEKLCQLAGDDGVEQRGDVGLLDDASTNADIVVVDGKLHKVPAEQKLSVPVIVLSEQPHFNEAFQLLQRGIRGYGNRMMRLSNLRQIVESVHQGQIWLPPALIAKLLDVVGSGMSPRAEVYSREKLLESLSKREREVALYVARGMSNQEMAEKMFVSLRTVKAHLSSIYGKTGVRNRLELGLALKD